MTDNLNTQTENKTDNKTSRDLSPTRKREDEIFGECRRHYQIGYQETRKRTQGHGHMGSITFDEADELFRSWIDEVDWPYDALVFDPRVFTFIFEKTSRLISSKPRGHLIPREESNILSAKINNALLDYQWDQGNNGGSMISKWAMMDMNTRKYGAAFGLCKWRYQEDPKGKVLFDGPEFTVLNNRDIATELTATAVENAHWVQVRQYVALQDLETVNDTNGGPPVYKNLERLRQAISAAQFGKTIDPNYTGTSGGDSRSVNWVSRNRAISRIETDPAGKDFVYKTVEVVTEYRRDRWVTFSPRHGVVIRDIANPYDNNEIPITLLRYYAIDDDIYGLSEIEPVKGLQKAINALLCQYLDEINQNLYSPIAVGPGVKMHTLEWGKGARWQMNNPNSDFRLVESRSNAAQYFNNTYSVLVAAMMNTLGESSLGISNMDPYQQEKTATEVKALQLQRNARDNYNQIMLSEAIKRQLMLWHSMNQLLLFRDPTKTNYLIRIVGKDMIQYFQQAGMGDEYLPETSQTLIAEQGITDADEIKKYFIPRFPVNYGTKKEPRLRPKMISEDGFQSALLAIEPQDLEGSFDFSVDVESMAVNADDQRRQARQTAIQLLTGNPNILMMLAQEGTKPKFKELFIDWLEDLGFIDADKFFESAQNQAGMPPQGMGSAAGGQVSPYPPQQTNFQPQGPGESLQGVVNKRILAQQPTNQNQGQPNAKMYNSLLSHIAGGQGAGRGLT